MRHKSTAAIVAIALVGAIAFSLTGQEDPLPAITPRTTLSEIPLAQPTVVLAVEPIHDFATPSLADAARANDYVTFNALYAQASAADTARFATLHELWTYAVTDPIGAFYGEELYRKLSSAYPGYAAYIAPYRIVDSRGNVFYPTSETRAFVLERAMDTGRAPRVQVASDTPIVPRPSRTRRQTAAAKPTARPAQPAAADPIAPVPVASPVVIAAAQPPVSAPVAAATQTPAPAPVATATQSQSATPAPAATETAILPTASSNPTGRGVLLVIVGLVGIGLLALILRTPGEKPVATIIPDNVEPLRKADPPPPPQNGSRASGTRG